MTEQSSDKQKDPKGFSTVLLVADLQRIYRGGNLGDSWSEFTIRDINGYRIAFGG